MRKKICMTSQGEAKTRSFLCQATEQKKCMTKREIAVELAIFFIQKDRQKAVCIITGPILEEKPCKILNEKNNKGAGEGGPGIQQEGNKNSSRFINSAPASLLFLPFLEAAAAAAGVEEKLKNISPG